MFQTANQLVKGRQYVSETGEDCFLGSYREWSTQSEGECEPVVVFPGTGRVIPPHLLGSLLFVERATVPAGQPRADRTPESGSSASPGRGPGWRRG